MRYKCFKSPYMNSYQIVTKSLVILVETPSKANMTISHTPLKKFDLKASLARPVTWKPYTGKIKTQYASKPAGGADHRDVKVKTPKVQTRSVLVI